MSQDRKTAPSISEVIKNTQKGKLRPVYYLFGEDIYSIDLAVKAIEDAVTPLIISDFDKDICYSDDRDLQNVVNVAQSFPFGSQKKLIIYKGIEKIRDKKLLDGYVSSPAEFTVLVLVHNGKITNLTSSPFNTLLMNDFLYEAKELRGKYLVDWIIDLANLKGNQISTDDAIYLSEISGENRLIIESQLEKIITYLGDKNEISLEVIQKVTSSFEQFTVFDLQNAVFQKDKSKSLKIAFNMLDNGENAVLIISMLTKAFIGLSQMQELKDKKISDFEMAKIISVPYFSIKNFQSASMLFSLKDLAKAAEALLKADTAIKTTTTDSKNVISLMIAELF